jgi:hypothetical protein
MIDGLIAEAEFKANRCCHNCGCSIDRDSGKKYKFYILCDSCAAIKDESQNR